MNAFRKTMIGWAVPWAEKMSRTGQQLAAQLDRAGDRLNPLLVKETRQALKSRQFVITFGLVLLACWICSIGGAVLIGPSIYFRPSGPELLMGYYVILALPLAVIVPFSAYRSLATEIEDDTYQLVSITTLSAQQIIRGKLGSAVVQTIVYLCAVAPCIAFTYLLRGVDILTIGYLLAYTVIGSLGLSLVGLLLATVTRERYAQVILGIGYISLLGWVFLGACAFTIEFMQWNGPFQDVEFWILNGLFATGFITTFALVYYAAVARISFESDNRSTRLRIVMLVQQLCVVAWLSWPYFDWVRRSSNVDAEVICYFLLAVCAYWYVMGMLMTGELPQLSMRVRRHLPQSVLGRALFTWLYPGPGTGYIFAIANLLGFLILIVIAMDSSRVSWADKSQIYLAAWIGWCYVVFFLGLGKLLLSWLRRFSPLNLLVGFGVHLVIVGTLTAVPVTFQLMSVRWRNAGYTLIQTTNPFWTLHEFSDGYLVPFQLYFLLAVVPSLAAVSFLLNLPSLAREVRQTRVSAPGRVAADDTQQMLAAKPVASSPWAEDTAS